MLFWIIVAVAIASSIGVAIYTATGYGFDRVVFFGSLGACLFISVVVLAIYSALASVAVMRPVEYSHSLRALQVGNSTHGSFFLGFGSVDSNPVVYYYKPVAAGYKLSYIDTYYATFVESDNPHYVMKCSKTRDSLVPWHVTGFCNNITFYVPKGSITNKIKVGFPS